MRERRSNEKLDGVRKKKVEIWWGNIKSEQFDGEDEEKKKWKIG